MADEIVTARLRLRPPRLDDLDAVHMLASDYEVVKQTATWPWPPDRAFSESRCQPITPDAGLGGLVFRGETLVGMMGLHAGAAGGTMGYMFARDHWGQGYATEAGAALIAAGFARFDWPRIEACVFDNNPASGRVLEKLGFQETGRCRGPSAAQGLELPMRTFRLRRPGPVSYQETETKSLKDFGPT